MLELCKFNFLSPLFQVEATLFGLSPASVVVVHFWSRLSKPSLSDISDWVLKHKKAMRKEKKGGSAEILSPLQKVGWVGMDGRRPWTLLWDYGADNDRRRCTRKRS